MLTTKLELKSSICEACFALERNRISSYTSSCISAIYSEDNLICVKPSGVEFDDTPSDDLPEIRLDGIIENTCDYILHMPFYRCSPIIRSVCSVTPEWSMMFAKTGYDIPSIDLQNMHNKTYHIPCLASSINFNGFSDEYGAVLIKSCGLFTWAPTPMEAVELVIHAEYAAKIAFYKMTQ